MENTEDNVEFILQQSKHKIYGESYENSNFK